jgi:hypothetical protein
MRGSEAKGKFRLFERLRGAHGARISGGGFSVLGINSGISSETIDESMAGEGDSECYSEYSEQGSKERKTYIYALKLL